MRLVDVILKNGLPVQLALAGQQDIESLRQPDGGRARRSVGQHAVSSMCPSFAASRARLAWRSVGLVTNSLDY
jgi:hypothetical protein